MAQTPPVPSATPQNSAPPPERPQPDSLVGTQLGQFQLEEEIGRGGMATVYRATQLSMERVVAVKVLPRALLHDPSFYERFTREVKVVAVLEHPHIVPIIDFGESDGMPYIAMRYLSGGSLGKMLRRGRPRLDEIVRPVSQIAQALDYAHRQGIIHRDLKPGNVLLDDHLNAYLSDFGIARVLGSEMTGSAIIGTPAYMSPEQANGQPLDARSDIYALGIVLFELITGREPFRAETPVAMILKHINEPMPSAQNFRADVPDSIDAIIQKATAKNPDDRFARAEDMAEVFAEAVRLADTGTFEFTGASMETLYNKETPLSGIDLASVSNITPLEITDNPTVTPATAEELMTASAIARAQASQAAQPQTGAGTTQDMPSTDPNALSMSHPSIQIEETRRLRLSLRWVLGLVGLLTAVVIVLAVLVLWTLQRDTNTAPLLPTPFPRASTMTQNLYSINIPDVWIPPQLYLNRSDAQRTLHAWRADDGTAEVTVALVPLPTEGADPFNSAVDAYRARYIDDGDLPLSLIDSARAPDGSVRTSYRVANMAVEGHATPGQLDVIYKPRANQLAVVTFYSADSTANNLVPIFQLVLDSLRIDGAG